MATKMNQHLHRLLERRDALKAEIAACQARLDEVEQTIRMFSGEPLSAPAEADKPQARKERGRNIKPTVLNMLQEHRDGLTVTGVMDLGDKLGMLWDRATVSSLLSRLKREETLTYDAASGRYRLAQPPLAMNKPTLVA